MDYSKDGQIDINALDIEWVTLPKKEEQYIEQVAELKKEFTSCVENHKMMHEKLKTVRSILIKKVHADPEKYIGKTKATAPEAEAFYRTHKKYKEAKQNEIDAEIEMIHAEDAWNTAKDMKDLLHFTKTKALENLVTLHGQGYFAGPKMPRDINREMERYEEKQTKKKKRSEKIGKGLKRK